MQEKNRLVRSKVPPRVPTLEDFLARLRGRIFLVGAHPPNEAGREVYHFNRHFAHVAQVAQRVLLSKASFQPPQAFTPSSRLFLVRLLRWAHI